MTENPVILYDTALGEGEAKELPLVFCFLGTNINHIRLFIADKSKPSQYINLLTRFWLQKDIWKRNQTGLCQ